MSMNSRLHAEKCKGKGYSLCSGPAFNLTGGMRLIQHVAVRGGRRGPYLSVAAKFGLAVRKAPWRKGLKPVLNVGVDLGRQ